NCGACGHVCVAANGTPTCNGGTCGISSCSAGFANCDGNPANGCETNTTTDVNNCGSCGQVCSPLNDTPACVNGVCASVCNAGFANCNGNPANGCETNITTDVNNCGSCGHICPPLTVCTAGLCH